MEECDKSLKHYFSAKSKSEKDRVFKNYINLVGIAIEIKDETTDVIKESKNVFDILSDSYSAIKLNYDDKFNKEFHNCFLLYTDIYADFEKKYIKPIEQSIANEKNQEKSL